jgi:hypothetical protein
VALGYKGAASFRHEGAAHAGLIFRDVEKAAQCRVLETRNIGPVFVKYKPMSEEAKEKLRGRRKTRERVAELAE